jgi:hypothetical protein
MIFYVVAAFLTVPLMFIWAQDLSVMLIAAALNAIFVPVHLDGGLAAGTFSDMDAGDHRAFFFNMPRLIAWVGPLISGWIIANLGGYT